MIRYILCSALLLVLMSAPTAAKVHQKGHFHHAMKHALLVKHSRTLAVTVHIPARALQKSARKPPHPKHKARRR